MSPFLSLLFQLFRCVGCRLRAPDGHFPLCRDCASSLISCPPFFTPFHEPWSAQAAADAGVRSFSARYLLINPGYRTLKRWKIYHGPLFNRWVLKSDSQFEEYWRQLQAQNEVKAIIPVPQRTHRSWQLRGSPALRIAHWVSQETKVPVVEALLPPPPRRRGRQAQLSVQARFENNLEFKAAEQGRTLVGKTVILVDDFFTTGHTIKRAAQTLREAGISDVHVFCLGVRVQTAKNQGVTIKI